MVKDAKKDGANLMIGSGYRSYDVQQFYYDNYVATYGQAEADKFSAKPGTSEHQTGLSLDFANTSQKCYLEICFENTHEGKWLKNNASKYGFILRYPKDKDDITGYQYEPWHFRYVGTDLAEQLAEENQTLEEFFNY
jgi:D-alanyl-D-alanine carboxypeptidase